MTTQDTVERYMETLRRVAHAEGPEQAEYLLASVGDDITRELARDMWGFADGLAVAHQALEARRRSWDERDAAWQRQRSAAKAEIAVMMGHLEDVLGSVAVGHRRRTKEATLHLPSGTMVRTIEYKDIDVRITDAAAFMAGIKGREDVPPGVLVPQPWALGLVAAKAYAKSVLESEVLPGVEVLPAGRTTYTVKHDGVSE